LGVLNCGTCVRVLMCALSCSILLDVGLQSQQRIRLGVLNCGTCVRVLMCALSCSVLQAVGLCKSAHQHASL
jgi:hypothetical protein